MNTHTSTSQDDRSLDDDKRREIVREFKGVINMTPEQLGKWLDGDASQRVGQKKDGDESVGHESGRRIIDILNRNPADLSDSDYAHMRKVVGYVHRHMAQGPTKQEIETSDWRYSLMNWGHDPLKK